MPRSIEGSGEIFVASICKLKSTRAWMPTRQDSVAVMARQNWNSHSSCKAGFEWNLAMLPPFG